MTTIYVVDHRQTTAPMQRTFHVFRRYHQMFREWQERNAVRGALYGLSDNELQDMGTTRGEIEYVARCRSIDPRNVRDM